MFCSQLFITMRSKLGVGFDSSFRSWGPTMDCFCDQGQKAPLTIEKFTNGSGDVIGKAVTVCTIETLTHIRFKGINVTSSVALM